jgi:hypothetical protein
MLRGYLMRNHDERNDKKLKRTAHYFWSALAAAIAGACLALVGGCSDSGPEAQPPKAIAWSSAALPAAAYWQDLCYGGGTFAAIAYAETGVAASDEAAYSTDGKNWSRATGLPAAFWNDIAYGHGVFVAVAWCNSSSSTTNIAAWSSDGIAWTQATLPSSAYWSSVAVVDGGFLALADGTISSQAAFSSDGKTWSGVGLGASAYWLKAAGDGTSCVAIARASAAGGDTPQTSLSTDHGASWASGGALPNAAQWQDIACKDGNFVAITASRRVPTGGYPAALSVDGGSTWNAADLPLTGDWIGLAVGGGVFATIANAESYSITAKAAWSADGASWHEVSLPYELYWNALAYGGGNFVALPYSDGSHDTAKAAYSHDGSTWTAADLPEAACWQAAAYGGGVFAAIGRTHSNNPTAIAAYSD